MRTNGSYSSTSDGRPSLSPDDAAAGHAPASRINSNITTRTTSSAHSTSPPTATSIPYSASPTKHSPVHPHPHYCPAQYHASSPDADANERHRSDTNEQHWDNVFLNSHLSVDAWKSQSKVAKKASQQQHSARHIGSDDDEADDEDDAASQNRGRTRRRRMSNADKLAGSQGSPKKDMGWKVKGISWAIGVSGV